MAEIIGLVSGVAGLVTFAAQITKLSYNLISDLKGASQNQKLYLQEVSALTDVLFQADTAASEASRLGLEISRPASLSEDLIANCTDQLSRIRDDLASGIKRSKWLFQERELKKRVEILHNFHSIFHHYLSTQALTVTTATYRQVSETGRREQRDQLLKWLGPTDETSKPAPIAAPCTGTWFLDSEQYRDWRDGESSSLWCYGAPGSGKSFLASLALQDLEQSVPGQSCVAAYFCDYALRKQQDPRSILQSLLRKLINQANDSTILGLTEFRDETKGEPDIKMLTDMVVTLCELAPSTYLILDAPDELEAPKRLISIFQTFAAAGCRVLVTSRDTPDLRHDLSIANKMEIRAVREDVSLFLEHCFRETGHEKIIRRGQDLIEEVIEKADGIFLLAKILVDKLLDMTTLAQMRKAMKTMPTTITEAFESSVKRIESQSPARRELAFKAISWITQAQRRLKAVELLHALAVEQDEDEFDEDNIPDIQLTLGVCVGLVVRDTTDDSIGMVHTTALEFFQGRTSSSSRQDIATVCLTYLTVPPFTDGPCKSLDEIGARHLERPFMAYAAKFWGDHVDEEFEEDLSDLIGKLLNDSDLRLSAFQALHYRPYITDRPLAEESLATMPTGQEAIHVAAYWNLSRTTKSLLGQGQDPCAKDSQQWTPLHWACSRGSLAAMEHLITAGADINAKDSQGWTPLFWLSVNGNETGMRLMLSKGANHLIRDVHGWTALTWAVSAHRQTAVQAIQEHHQAWLSELEARPARRVGDFTVRQAKDRFSQQDTGTDRTAIEVAADIGDTDLLNMLCSQKTVDFGEIWSRGGFDVPVSNVWRTMSKGESMYNVEYYLKSWGRQALPTDAWKGKLLHGAIKDDKYMIARALIELGADVNCDLTRNPLHAAAFRTDPRYARLLLEHGADPSLCDQHGQTPLHQAVINGFVETTVELLQGGSEVNGRVLKKGRQYLLTPLIMACGLNAYRSKWFQHDGKLASEMASTLISHGADVSLKDRKDMTALHHAAKAAHHEVVQQLLNAGVDVDGRDIYGKTPLHYAASSADRATIESLVNANADIEAVDAEGKHMIHLFAEGGWDGLEDLQEMLALLTDSNNPDALNVEWTIPAEAAPGDSSQTEESHDSRDAAARKPTQNALTLALKARKWELVELLHRLGATLPLGFEAQSALHEAVKEIRPQIVGMLLEHGANPKKTVSELQDFQLWYRREFPAIFRWKKAVTSLDKFEVMLKQLLDAGLDINEHPDSVMSLLMDAIDEVDSAELTRLLVDLGADVSLETAGGLDVFLIAALRGHWKALDTLLDYALPSLSKDHWITFGGLWVTEDEGRNSLQYVLDAVKGYDLVETRKTVEIGSDKASCTLLWLSAALDNDAMVNGLRRHGADPNVVDECGWRPIHIATFRGCEAVIRELLLAGADVSAATHKWHPYYQMHRPSGCPLDWQGTALHLASMKGFPEIAELLISHGANVTTHVQGTNVIAPGTGPTALHLALDTRTFYGERAPCLGEKKLQIAKVLVQNGADVSTVADHLRLEDVLKFEGHEDFWEELRKGISEGGARAPSSIRW
ncbi:ankyrin repeat-containing domain protein [Thelonectria olida]|uniref:Ankyrin repeat-containing domain protein n=1 Tax=Thelonectria olida TaxID=1576542 RepID=A0A9P9AQP1_9HYPO|nr:ankyrin repeat-containing domain protein [Thelonectria olida]